MKGAKLVLPTIGVLVLIHLSCVDSTGPANETNGRIAITNDPAMLAGRVTYYNSPVPVDSSGVGYPSAPAPAPRHASLAGPALAPPAPPFTLTLVAEVASPTINGQVLQATSVAIVGTRAVVSYNMAGSPYLGGVDLYDFSSGVVLKSQALFQNTDVNAVTTSGQNVFLAEATGDTGFQHPAVLENMKIQGTTLVLGGNRRKAVTSFAATGVTASGGRAYLTSGNTGSLYRVDTSSFALLDSVSLPDARWVDVAGGKVAVVQGMPGTLAVFNETNLAPLGTYPFKGADIAESKSTVQLVGGKAFIAAGDSGVQVLSATTGTALGSVARPNPASLGLSPSVVVTNAVSVDSDLVFISNGEAGVYVAQGSQPFSATGAEVLPTITMRGRLRFANLQSVNHVAYLAPYLVIAAGLGGIKVVLVSR
jgi:outer membrane protein assembly factor BamB